MQYTTVLLLALGLAGAGAVKWGLKDTDGKYCVIFSAETIDAQLNILTAENVTETISFKINATAGATDGNCHFDFNGHPANQINARFYPNGQTPASATDAQPWRLTLTFTTDNKDVAFKLADYQLETSPSALFNTTTRGILIHLLATSGLGEKLNSFSFHSALSSVRNKVFTKASSELDLHASGTNGYKCSTTGFSLSDDSRVDVKDARVIANARLESDSFPEGQTFEQCVLDSRTSDIVPIVVGACLAGLVAVVLVAYLVGRARAKRQGYASV
ncbi:lmp-1 [Pristionchus pacificus]|uniref:Lmp-1 n=1 Tax=Pristionchus pacificus TaxID=54126 RepID=A0A2A6C533_PRIPA|nr:lmp-1 [Pristionchus pacificus]|eukprot:PDM73249.1 lmp-1 [Pristionchus pacificus]